LEREFLVFALDFLPDLLELVDLAVVAVLLVSLLAAAATAGILPALYSESQYLSIESCVLVAKSFSDSKNWETFGVV
jgi:hypothetical protein